MEYDLPLADEKVKPHQVTTLHLVSSLAFIGAGAIIVIYNYTIPYWGLALLLVGLGLLGLTLFRNNWLTSPKINPVFRVIELFFAVAFEIYSIYMQWKFPIVIFGGLSAGILISLYWERLSDNRLFVHVDEKGLHLPVVRRRFIPWTEIDLVVMRFGTITINCLDNHLFQWSLAETDIKSEQFEAYCNKMVEENIPNRLRNDW